MTIALLVLVVLLQAWTLYLVDRLIRQVTIIATRVSALDQDLRG